MAKTAVRRADSVHLLQLSSAAGCHRVEVGKVKRIDFSAAHPAPFNSLFLTLCSSPRGAAAEYLTTALCVIT